MFVVMVGGCVVDFDVVCLLIDMYVLCIMYMGDVGVG